VAQFTVYKNTSPQSRKFFPYLLDVQSDLLSQLQTTVVIPLGKLSDVSSQVMTTLCPIIEIEGKEYGAITQQLASIDKKLLGAKIADLSDRRFDFISALDFIISGI
jgi:toxin CcdB